MHALTPALFHSGEAAQLAVRLWRPVRGEVRIRRRVECVRWGKEERNGAGDVISGCAIVGGGQHRKHTCHPFFLSSKTMATFILSSPPPSTSAAPDDAEEQQQSCWLYAQLS
jgi:hypothetical protein